MGSKDCGRSCLFPTVVSVRFAALRCSDSGRKCSILSVRSETVDVIGRENERVGGNPKPGKDDSKIFKCCAIF